MDNDLSVRERGLREQLKSIEFERMRRNGWPEYEVAKRAAYSKIQPKTK